MQVEGWEKEQVGKVSAVEVCWELSKTLHLLGNSSERDMVTLLTVTQLSQATIYEKQLTPEQGRAKRELQTPPQSHRGTPSPPQSQSGTRKNAVLGCGSPPKLLPSTLGWAVQPGTTRGWRGGSCSNFLGGESQHGSCQRKPSFTTNNTSKGTVYNYSIN